MLKLNFAAISVIRIESFLENGYFVDQNRTQNTKRRQCVLSETWNMLKMLNMSAGSFSLNIFAEWLLYLSVHNALRVLQLRLYIFVSF